MYPLHKQYQTSSYWAERFMNNAEFVGGVTDGVVGLASMDYNRPHIQLTTLKSWFFFEDVIVVVGSRISLSKDDATGEDVITTLAQVCYFSHVYSQLYNFDYSGTHLGSRKSYKPLFL